MKPYQEKTVVYSRVLLSSSPPSSHPSPHLLFCVRPLRTQTPVAHFRQVAGAGVSASRPGNTITAPATVHVVVATTTRRTAPADCTAAAAHPAGGGVAVRTARGRHEVASSPSVAL